MTAWSAEHPTQPGQYLIRPLPRERLVVGTETIAGERLVQVAYLHGMHPERLMVLLDRSAIAARGSGLEFRGPLTREELVEIRAAAMETQEA